MHASAIIGYGAGVRMRRGPRALWLVRHGQSEGNVIRDAAEAALEERYELTSRDADVPLSDLGRRQAQAFGRWLAKQPDGEHPTFVLTSPYLRARQTAQGLLEAAGLNVAIEHDERLRDREMGEWDGLTWRGVQARHPREAERGILVGRFYHRPPGGESWADMMLRLRSLLADVALDLAHERVLVVAHDVPIQLVRAIVDGLDEEQTIRLVRENAYANCALTAYERASADGAAAVTAEGGGSFTLTAYNRTVPIETEGEPATQERDVPAGR